jgi:hypothetical protein
MSLLPTAHAGQHFGTRRIDFFTVSGQVSETEAHHGRITDDDGMDHDVRLMDDNGMIAKGDVATVLRVQSGPNRRSCAVAVVDHSRGTWLRTSPDATNVLARSGVTRSFNWWLSILLLLVIAAGSVWPVLHAFLTEISGSLMSGVPVFDLYDDLAARAPGLTEWRLEAVLPTGIHNALASQNVVPMSQMTEWGLSVAAALLAIIAFAARSWRLIYVPAFAVLAVLSGGILGGADTTLAMTGGALALFLIGGMVNRIRDGGRFNARVERLADHVLRNPPQEGVRTSDSATLSPGAATAAAAIATATAVAEADTPDVEAVAAEPEVEETTAAEDTSSEPIAAAEPTDTTIEAVNEVEAAIAVASPTEAVVEDIPADDSEDDDLPSMDEVKAAAVLALAESETSDDDDAPTIDLDDERTMPVAPPPPMPVQAAPEAEPEIEDPAPAEAAEPEVESTPAPEAELADEDTLEPSASLAEAPIETETVDPTAETIDEPDEAPGVAPADDPLIDDAADPMVGATEPSDYAPGAPDIEFDKSPAE